MMEPQRLTFIFLNINFCGQVHFIIHHLQPILDKNTSLSQALSARLILAYRQPSNLKQLLTRNGLPNTDTE